MPEPHPFPQSRSTIQAPRSSLHKPRGHRTPSPGRPLEHTHCSRLHPRRQPLPSSPHSLPTHSSAAPPGFMNTHTDTHDMHSRERETNTHTHSRHNKRDTHATPPTAQWCFKPGGPVEELPTWVHTPEDDENSHVSCSQGGEPVTEPAPPFTNTWCEPEGPLQPTMAWA